jgi:hypothetical protein
MTPGSAPVHIDTIAQRIHVIRGQRVMLDSDLAALYGVSTKQLNQAVRRNARRFPVDFAFRLHRGEAADLRSQFVTSSFAWGGRRYAPYAFTEHGAVMLASVLNSPVAVAASIQVVRAFIQLRGLLASQKVLVRRLDELEDKYDSQFKVVFQAIRELMQPPAPARKRIGFQRS